MNLRAVWVLCCALLCTLPAWADGSSDSAVQLKLVPEPKEVRMRVGGFRVGPATRILVEFGHQDEDRIAAETLAEEISDESGLQLDIVGVKATSKTERSSIVLARLQDLRVRKFLAARGLISDESIGEQGYLLFADKSHLVVAANSGSGLFYGVQTLRQLLRPNGKVLVCPAIAIRDWPSLEWHGAEEDVSRGPISTRGLVETQARLAEFKAR
ncbi:MAG TPA: glycoside hydrolase family 20 zincin-like fold domain-containing protein [Candidatus Sulfotelmatobacter sp.]